MSVLKRLLQKQADGASERSADLDALVGMWQRLQVQQYEAAWAYQSIKLKPALFGPYRNLLESAVAVQRSYYLTARALRVAKKMMEASEIDVVCLALLEFKAQMLNLMNLHKQAQRLSGSAVFLPFYTQSNAEFAGLLQSVAPMDISHALYNGGFYASGYSKGQQSQTSPESWVDVIFSPSVSLSLYLQKYLAFVAERHHIQGAGQYPGAEVHRFIASNIAARRQGLSELGEDKFDFIKLRCSAMSYIDMPARI